MGTVRAELAFALENRGESAARSPARSRRWRWHWRSIGLLRARPRSSPEASCSASRSGRRSPARPAVVVLDEPTSQLDPVAGDELIGLLRRLNEDGDLTIVLSEHRLERCLAAR